MSKSFSVLVCLAMLSLSGCGFALRGTDDSLHISPAHQRVSIQAQDTPEAFALKQPLTKYLNLRGVSLATGNTISLDNVRFRQYKLIGTLTEVRLVLMADITYQIGEQKHAYPLQVERSYQYNEASVATLDGQGDQAKAWLYDALAERIAEQYRAIAQSAKP